MADEHHDAVDDAFDVSEDFVASPQHTAATTKAVDFDGLLGTPLLLHEDPKEGNGGLLWIAGMILSKYLLRRKIAELQKSSMLVVLPRAVQL